MHTPHVGVRNKVARNTARKCHSKIVFQTKLKTFETSSAPVWLEVKYCYKHEKNDLHRSVACFWIQIKGLFHFITGY